MIKLGRFASVSSVLVLLGAGAAGCSGADVPETAAEQAGSTEAELHRGGSVSWICAGPRERECSEGRFCASLPGRCPGEAQLGICIRQPTACTKEFRPVCGCDGATYGNACEAAAAGVSVDHAGECERGGEFCGGIAGFPCPDPERQACVDDPSDDCDPEMGGADCGGVCVETCGDALCGIGLVCCNPVMGICTPPGGVCIQ